MIVKLEYWEMLMAANAGFYRHVENLKLKRKPAYGAGSDNDWQLNIEGALGEMALAKHLNIYWGGKGFFRGDDVGPNQARTRSKDYYDLIIQPKDFDDKAFWLLCGKNGVYNVKGWIYGIDGKKREYWADPAGGRPAYFVPQSVLNPITERPV